jgi:RNA polymerase sigma-70 factor (family 1)
MPASITNDNDLLQNIIKGDEESFRKLYEKYYTQVYLFAIRLIKVKTSAEDIAQQVFIKIWETRNRLDLEKNFRTYLLTITRNLIIDSLKKASRDRQLMEKIFKDMKGFDENAFSLLLEKEITRLHHQAINELPNQRKIIYKLSREGEMNYDEIANFLSISKNTVRNQVSDALKSVREYVRKHSDMTCLFLLLFQ